MGRKRRWEARREWLAQRLFAWARRLTTGHAGGPSKPPWGDERGLVWEHPAGIAGVWERREDDGWSALVSVTQAPVTAMLRLTREQAAALGERLVAWAAAPPRRRVPLTPYAALGLSTRDRLARDQQPPMALAPGREVVVPALPPGESRPTADGGIELLVVENEAMDLLAFSMGDEGPQVIADHGRYVLDRRRLEQLETWVRTALRRGPRTLRDEIAGALGAGVNQEEGGS